MEHFTTSVMSCSSSARVIGSNFVPKIKINRIYHKVPNVYLKTKSEAFLDRNVFSERFLGTVIYCLLPVIEVAKLNGAFPVVTDSEKLKASLFICRLCI